jgi:hypothetical protein
VLGVEQGLDRRVAADVDAVVVDANGGLHYSAGLLAGGEASAQ